jgi:hypothetical protein
VTGVVTVPIVGVLRQDMFLADSAAEHGPAIIRGRVSHANGKSVKSGRVVIATLGRDVAVQDGTFVLGDLPLGSWAVEARVIGVEPQSVIVNATDAGITTPNITVSDHAQRLDAVTVVGKPDRNTLLLDEVLRRRRSSFGTFFLPNSPALKSALHTVDVLSEARGFSTARCARDGIVRCYQGRLGCRSIAVYVNGAIYPEGFESLDLVAPPDDVLAVEAYPDVGFAPVQWRGNVGLDRNSLAVCAVVVVWTRQ